MIFLYKYWFRIYLRTRANTQAGGVLLTPRALFRPQKTYFPLSEGLKSLELRFSCSLNSTIQKILLRIKSHEFSVSLLGRPQKVLLLMVGPKIIGYKGNLFLYSMDRGVFRGAVRGAPPPPL